MTVTDTDLKFVSALVFGTLVIAVSTLPFIFRIINKTKEARETDNFNLFIVILNSYFFLLVWVVAISTTVYIVDLLDVMDYLNLLGSGGAFELFWKTGVDNSTTVSTTATYLIKWVRSFYEWLSIISAILVIFFGFIGGYQYQKKANAKAGQDVDWMSYIAGVVGVFLGVVLLKLYSEITKYSLFVPNNQSIIEVIKETFRTSMGV